MPKRKNAYPMRRVIKRRRSSKVPRPVACIVRKNKLLMLNEVSLSTLSQGNTWYDPLSIPHGTDHTDRTGHSIRVTGIKFRGLVHNNADEAHVCRVVVLQTDLDGNFTADTDFMESSANDGGVSVNDAPGLATMSYPIDTQVAKPLFDRTIVLGPKGTDTGIKTVETFVRFNPPLLIKYRGGNAGANAVFPRIHFGAWCAEADDDANMGQTTELSGVIKTYFHDA